MSRTFVHPHTLVRNLQISFSSAREGIWYNITVKSSLIASSASLSSDGGGRRGLGVNDDQSIEQLTESLDLLLELSLSLLDLLCGNSLLLLLLL